MTDPAGSGVYPRPSSSAAGYSSQSPKPSSSPRPSVTSRGSISSLRRQAALAAAGSSASVSHSISPPEHHLPQQLLHHDSKQPHGLLPPRFTQLFTTLATITCPSNRTTTHYPTVHYVFDDDDPDTLAEALARQHRAHMGQSYHSPSERAILIDVVPSPANQAGFEVACASSLSPDWAVINTRISRMEGAAGVLHGGHSAGSLVLEIEGVSNGAEPSLQEQHDQEQNLDEILGQFGKNMDMMQRVMMEFEKRRSALQGIADDAGPVAEDETQTLGKDTQRPEDRLQKQDQTATKDKEKEAGGDTAERETDSVPQPTATE